MKILHVIASVNPGDGGTIESVIKSSEVWQRKGHSRAIVSLDPPTAPWVAACPISTTPLGLDGKIYGVARKYLPWLRYRYTPRLVPWLKAHAKEYDAVVVNGLWNYAAFGSWRALRNTDTIYFVYPHGMLDPWFKKVYPLKNIAKQIFWWFSEGKLMSGARGVLFTSEEERVLARGAFWPYRLKECFVGNGVSDVSGDHAKQVEVFLETFPQLRGRRFLLFLGRIHPKKGCDLLISAFAQQAAAHPDLDLVIAGPDQLSWQRTLETLVRENGIEGRVVWPGMLQNDLKWGAFFAADAFILPSHQENFGMAVAEALACGTPVLISDKVNIWREIDAMKAGFVAPDDLQGTSDLLLRFLSLSEKAKSAMSAAARQCFLEKFEIERSAMNLLNFIQLEIERKDK